MTATNTHRLSLLAGAGLAVLAGGVAWAYALHQPFTALGSIPFVLVTVGFALLVGTGGLMRRDALGSQPSSDDDFDIERDDERNRSLAAASKARGFDFAMFALPSLALAMAALRAPVAPTVALLVTYLLMLVVSLAARGRLEREN